jgi:hypothetical protein
MLYHPQWVHGVPTRLTRGTSQLTANGSLHTTPMYTSAGATRGSLAIVRVPVTRCEQEHTHARTLSARLSGSGPFAAACRVASAPKSLVI